MLNKNNRLSKSSWQKVLESPNIKYGNASFLILLRINQNQQSKLGLSVAKRNIKNAVSRNKFKRIIREWFRKNFLVASNTTVDVDVDVDVVVFARKGFSAKNHKLFTAELEQSMPKIIHKLHKCKN